MAMIIAIAKGVFVCFCSLILYGTKYILVGSSIVHAHYHSML